jgi:hypothetical protein
MRFVFLAGDKNLVKIKTSVVSQTQNHSLPKAEVAMKERLSGP